MSDARPAVTIVGAGPTGLTLAVELLAAGVSFRIVDASPTPVHESRALAIQARTLEVLERSGIAEQLVDEGDRARVIELHGTRDVRLRLFDGAESRTPYPFLLFLSQARTEQILLDHLQRHGVRVERDTELVGLAQDADGVRLEVQTAAGRRTLESDYLVGCDGAHSAARRLTGIPFVGSGFPQAFAIADLEVDGLDTGRVHAYLASSGVMFFFPLGSPATWRLLVMLPAGVESGEPDISLLQRVVDDYSGPRTLLLRDPAWITRFQVQSRYAQRFRDRRIFFAGDAAHIHSPAGAQGMNTGIQDAVNLGWKLAQVVSGQASDGLLESYEDERRPVARDVLRMTDRLFRMATTPNPLVRFVRPRAAASVVSVVARSRLLRRTGFRVISQIGLTYRNRRLAKNAHSDALGRLRAGDRLPPLQVIVDGTPVDLRTRITSPTYLLAVIGARGGSLSDPRLTVVWGEWPGSGRETWLLVRPDGYIAGIWRASSGVREFLDSQSRP